jgi:hypothetical protein
MKHCETSWEKGILLTINVIVGLGIIEIYAKSTLNRWSTCQAATTANSVISKVVALITGYLPCVPAKELLTNTPVTKIS